MTINPITQSKTNLVTSAIQINALDSANLASYYQEVIGLTLIKEDTGYYALGTPDQHILLEIFPTSQREEVKATGLYHMAFLLPTMADLGTILMHFVKNQVPLTGASDHGYSNALYMDDPEGNGIEIYVDKDKSEWDVQEDGRIAGIVEQMDVESVVKNARPSFDGMPNGTTMGHIHLHVGDIDASRDFFLDVLGLGFKFPMGQAIFMASGDYHHHLGANLWKGSNLPAPATLDQQGLRASIWEGNQADYDYVLERLNANNIAYENTGSQLSFKDNSGLHTIVQLAK